MQDWLKAAQHSGRMSVRLCCGGLHGTLPRCLPAPTTTAPMPPVPNLAALQDDTTGFAQLTVCIPSQQRFAAYDRRGILVAGDPEKVGGSGRVVEWCGCVWGVHVRLCVSAGLQGIWLALGPWGG